MILRINTLLAYGKTKIFSNLSIAKKIAYGYSLSIGIALTGTTVGFLIADYYQGRAQQELNLIEEQQDLLYSLENAILTIHQYPQQILIAIEDSIWLQYHTNKLLIDVNKVQDMLSQLNIVVEQKTEKFAVNNNQFHNWIDNYKHTTTLYGQFLYSLSEKIDAQNLSPDEIYQAEQIILTSIRGEQATELEVQFESLAEELIRIQQDLETKKQQANTKLQQANTLRVQIILVSLLLSSLIAASFAIRTSRAIASPLEDVTKIAQEVTSKANFKLQANVVSNDEVGCLATSLNQLINWAGKYTQELELSRNTLEIKVEERTQELSKALQNLKQTQMQLIQSEKMSSLGQMVAGIAHEVNNPVNFIHGNLGFINEYTKDLLNLIHLYQNSLTQSSPEIEAYLEEIDFDYIQEDLSNIISSMNLGTTRIQNIVLSLRNFSRLDEAEIKKANLHEGIDNTLLILNHRLKHGVEVVKQYGDLPLVLCHPAQLNQVFMNILTNAIDALFENNIEPKKIVIHTAKIDSDQVQVTIRDNGPGIPEQIRHQLFDPFFTTKPVGKGTGLGLSIAYQIVNQHQGQVEVKSEIGKGTEFVVILPV